MTSDELGARADMFEAWSARLSKVIRELEVISDEMNAQPLMAGLETAIYLAITAALQTDKLATLEALAMRRTQLYTAALEATEASIR